MKHDPSWSTRLIVIIGWLPSGGDMMDFVMKLSDQPEEMKAEAQRRVDQALARGERIKGWGLVDGFRLCSDYCFNDNPFLSPAMFDEFVTPYRCAARTCAGAAQWRLCVRYQQLRVYRHEPGTLRPDA